MTTETSRRIRSVTWLRTIASGLFGILAVVGLVASLVAVWATNVLYSKDSIAGVVDAALREPEVTDGLATLLTDELLKAVDLQTVLSDQLPDPLAPVVPAIVGGVRSFVKDTFEDVLTSSTTRNTLVTLVEVSHTALVRLLDGDGLGDGFTVTDDEVSVNLLPLLGLGVSALQQNGLLTNLEMPELAVSGNPVDQIAALERATGRDLPESFGQLVLFRGDAVTNGTRIVQTAQHTVVLVRRAIAATMVLTVLSAAAAIALARKRRRAALLVLLATAFVMVVVRAATNAVVAQAPTLALQPGARAAISSTAVSLTSSFITLVTISAVLAVGVAAVVHLTGASAAVAGLRSRAGQASGSVGALMLAHRDTSSIALVGAAALFILLAGFGATQLVVAGILCLAAALVQWWPDRPASAPSVDV
ncbi:MAG TPA: hypothetical protein DCR14_05125 [Acidimicrobiaceae bacterium]|nr:hypothetical protein [Acidimicrobiaceae bacterium]